MNQFMVLVERAVRPVKAGPKRKLRMREELLAHLASVYEEELVRLGTADAARAEAIRRFGDHTALTADLQATVTRSERIDARLDRVFGWRPGESAARYSARLAGLVAILLLLWLFFALVVSGVKRPDDATVPTSAMLLRLWAAILVTVPASVFLVSLLYRRVRDSLLGTVGGPASWWRALGYAALSYLVPPILGTVFWLLAVPSMGDAVKEMTSTRSILISTVAYLIVPVWLVAQARRVGPRELRHAEWCSLDIGQ